MRLRRLVMLLSLALASGSALGSGSEVLQVVDDGASALVAPKSVGTWREGDDVCALRESKEIACGKIARVLPQGAMVLFQGDRDPVRKGDLVLNVGDKRPALIASPVSESLRRAHYAFLLVSGGTAMNFDFLRAVGNVMVATSKYTAIGVHLSYVSEADPGEPTFVGKTGMLTLNFFNRRGMQGLQGQLAGGIEQFTLSSGGVNGRGQIATGLAAFGWRNKFSRHFSLGVIAGIQYVDRRRSNGLETSEDRFNPYLQADLAIHL